MAKAIKHSEIAREIKKDYLMQHLDDVRNIITNWIPQLNSPAPLFPREVLFGWQSIYGPSVEIDPDSNHILRHHAHSRALWRHHNDWELKLSNVWELTVRLKEQVDDIYSKLPKSKSPECKENFLGIALWVAFDSLYLRKSPRIHYETPDDQKGVACGNYRIDSVASTKQERSSIQKKHQQLIKSIIGIKELKDLTDSWQEVKKIEEQMQTIANKILKSRDILYPCRFCRHLWK